MTDDIEHTLIHWGLACLIMIIVPLLSALLGRLLVAWWIAS